MVSQIVVPTGHRVHSPRQRKHKADAFAGFAKVLSGHGRAAGAGYSYWVSAASIGPTPWREKVPLAQGSTCIAPGFRPAFR